MPIKRRAVAVLVAAAAVLATAAVPAGGAQAAPAPVTAASTTAAAAPVRVDVNLHLTWASWSWAQRAVVLDRMQAAGVRLVRMDLNWQELQPRPQGPGTNGIDPTYVQYVDDLLKLLASRDIKALVTVLQAPQWASGNPDPRVVPASSVPYANIVAWVARRWSASLVGVEIWNEPNIAPQMTVGRYADYVKASYRSIRRVAPTRVVIGALAYSRGDWLEALLGRYGARGQYDVLSVHPYNSPGDQDPLTPDDGQIWHLTHLPVVHQIMQKWGDGGRPVWVTEFGWSVHGNPAGTPGWARGVSAATQALYLERAVGFIRSLPWVTAVFWYSGADEPSATVHNANFGLVLRDAVATPKLSYWTLRRLNGVA